MKLAFALLVSCCAASLAQQTPHGQVCDIVRSDSATTDDSTRIAAGCRTAGDRYVLLTGRSAPHGTVTFGASPLVLPGPQNGRWRFRWLAEAQLRHVATKLQLTEREAVPYTAGLEQWVFPHELGHALDMARWGDEFSRVPAWYDEATAMWMEPAEWQRRRLQQAQDGQASAPSLASVLSFRRPPSDPAHAVFSHTVTWGPCRGMCGHSWRTRSITWRLGDDGTATSDTLYDAAADRSIAHGDSVSRYYVYSLAALYYVQARSGTAGLHALAARIGPGLGATDPLAGLPGVPPPGPAREADWREWLRTAAAAIPR